MDDFNDFLFFLAQKLSTNSWDRVGNWCCLQRHNEEGHFVFDICQLLLKNHWSVWRRRAVTDKKTHLLCIDPKVFVCLMRFPRKKIQTIMEKSDGWERDDAVIRNSIQKPSTIFKAIILLRCRKKKFDPTCHNRQQHCHLTITGSRREKQINAKWKEGFRSYF